MQNSKVGNLIRTVRKEHSMTQKMLAEQLNISDKTVSKWECGLGLPDISLIPELSQVLGVDMENLLIGDMAPNDFVGGNMKNTRYYVCPNCHNITLCTGKAEVSCCGKKLIEQSMKKADEKEKLTVSAVEDNWHIISTHPMNKEHYISFVAIAKGDRIQLIKQYPEWDLNVHISGKGHGMLIWYCTQHGLFYQLL